VEVKTPSSDDASGVLRIIVICSLLRIYSTVDLDAGDGEACSELVIVINGLMLRLLCEVDEVGFKLERRLPLLEDSESRRINIWAAASGVVVGSALGNGG
jgi:hypothetical protein